MWKERLLKTVGTRVGIRTSSKIHGVPICEEVEIGKVIDIDGVGWVYCKGKGCGWLKRAELYELKDVREKIEYEI